MVPGELGLSLFGIGFGITQNATFALMIDREPGADHAEAAYVISEVEVLDETQGQRYRELAAASGLDAARRRWLVPAHALR